MNGVVGLFELFLVQLVCRLIDLVINCFHSRYRISFFVREAVILMGDYLGVR